MKILETEKGVGFLGYVYKLASGRWQGIRTAKCIENTPRYCAFTTEEKVFDTKAEADEWVKFPRKDEE